ncbi:hypothetical protein O6P43_014656 [Quillaja saponaria]|uniref:Uncharacterized protein n=1 Tax=Quillaja saponaria TaxID=32244 RepID=A0AAD7LV54_QUISA|nr:hypothetical protein O6P43_014656 [Quillaja saponaria]
MLEKADRCLLTTTDHCIYKVPLDIRKHNEEAYTPKVISIGPFHNGDERLQNMEMYKLRYLKKFLERNNRMISLEDLVKKIKEIEQSIRNCYANIIELKSDELVKIILVDTSFILELLWRSYSNDWTEEDSILKPWLNTSIRIDLLLLENQLPFFVLENIFNEVFASQKRANAKFPTLVKLTFDYFKYYNKMGVQVDPDISIKHFTDMLRIFNLPPPEDLPRREDVDKTEIHLRSVTELAEAGLKFRRGSSECLLDLQLSGRYLKIPPLKLDGHTDILFCNLLALEQCHYPYDAHITDYITILDFLIDTGKDVDILVEKGIMVNWIGDSDAAAKLVNDLWKNVTQVNLNSHYKSLYKDLDTFYKNPMNRGRATLKRDYCNTPWKKVVSFGGVLLLFLAAIQTIFTVKSAV